MAHPDVETRLLKARVRRRRPPYPLTHSTNLLNFDNWDHMFLFPFSLTIHQFDTPPPMVLDLGCGGGYWSIEAAKKWEGSTIIGFDINHHQPKLDRIHLYHELAQRVKWVHGNLLDKLPFPSHHFDFIHVVGIGLGVPEDEWQFVLEEIARILKPGGVLEIIEEDLIFPCGSPPPSRPPALSLDLSNTATLSSRSSINTSATTPSSFLTDAWTLSSDQSTRSYFRQNSFTEETPPPSHSSSSDDPSPRHSVIIIRDGQDHSKLKAAWDAMLANRFLAPKLLSVLPFYLSSTLVDVRTHPALQVPLPPNSTSHSARWRAYTHEAFNPENLFDMRTSLGKPSTDDGDTESICSGKPSHKTVSSSAPMHLAKTMQTIIACKEAIWTEYERLFENDLSMPLVTRTSRPDEIPSKPKIHPVREEFERVWSNWENDMLDRIGARDYIRSEFSWNEPSGERPDWRIWRDSVVDTTSFLDIFEEPAAESAELCRSIRGFVGWAPLDGHKPTTESQP